MDFIVLDIEFNGRKFASELPMEVIEIGAVRLNPALEVVDEFSSLIKPIYFSKLNSFIKQKTGILQEDIDRAPGFVSVITDFVDWLKRFDTPIVLVTWGGEDVKRIVFDTRMHKLDDAYWMAMPYYNLLKGFLRAKGLTNDVSVEGALAALELAPSGTSHRALDDAKMTAEVFKAMFNELDLERIDYFKDQFSNAKERRIVKNAIRILFAQKITPTWEALVEHVLTGKVSLEDPRKAAELKEFFLAEFEKQKK